MDLSYNITSVTSSLLVSSGSSSNGTFENYDGSTKTTKDIYIEKGFNNKDYSIGLVMAIVFGILALGIIGYLMIMKSSSLAAKNTAKV